MEQNNKGYAPVHRNVNRLLPTHAEQLDRNLLSSACSPMDNQLLARATYFQYVAHTRFFCVFSSAGASHLILLSFTFLLFLIICLSLFSFAASPSGNALLRLQR